MNESTVDVVHGKRGQSGQVCKEASCFELVGADDLWYDGLEIRRGWQTLRGGGPSSVSFGTPWPSGTDWAHCLLGQGRLEHMVLCPGFWVWRYMSLIMPCVEHQLSLPSGREETFCQAAVPRRSAYSEVFKFRRLQVPAAWAMWMAEIAQSTLLNLPHPYKSWPERDGSVCIQVTPHVIKKPATRAENNEAEQDVGKTIVTNKNDGRNRNDNLRKKGGWVIVPQQEAQIILLRILSGKLQLHAYYSKRVYRAVNDSFTLILPRQRTTSDFRYYLYSLSPQTFVRMRSFCDCFQREYTLCTGSGAHECILACWALSLVFDELAT